MNVKLNNLLANYEEDINILYVEDSKDTALSTMDIFSEFFDNIDLASNGQEGLNLFKQNPDKYDIVITDLDMPILDGISMIKEIKKIKNDIYIVIFSVHNDPDYFIETINIGINGYILKPFKINQFIDMSLKFVEHLTKISQNKSAHKNDNEYENDTTNKDDFFLIHLENDFSWDISNNVLIHNKKIIKLTKNEIKLFECLSSQIIITHTVEDLSSYIFENEDTQENGKLRNLIAKLKQKLNFQLIDSSYGLGYKLKLS